MGLTNALTEVIDLGESCYGGLNENQSALAKRAIKSLLRILINQSEILGVWLDHDHVICWNCYDKEEVEGDPELNSRNILLKGEVERSDEPFFCDRCGKEIIA